MTAKHRHFIWPVLIILALVLNLLNVQVALADDSTPTPPPVEEPTQPLEESSPTEEPTQLPEESSPTEEPLSETSDTLASDQIPSLDETTTVTELLAELPETTEVVVLDENGNPVSLATQEAAEIMMDLDPMWCPAGVLPGGTGCTINFPTINDLMIDITANTTTYDENGIIYFTSTASGPFTLTAATITGGDYTTLKAYNLTLQGGWNGLNGIDATFTGQTDFGSNTLQIGLNANRWVGTVTLNNFVFNNTASTAITIFTTNGSITLDDVDVNNHAGNNDAVNLISTSGNIIIQNGSVFDGDEATGDGVSATTGTGSITVSDSVFQQFVRTGNSTRDGLTLSAPKITLNNVSSTNNDGDGISITNASLVTLNNVTASNNGTEKAAAGLAGNDGSGVVISGPASSIVRLIGGTFNNNQEYGVEIGTPANTTLYIQTDPICTGNDSNAAPTSSCYNTTPVSDSTGPVITPSISGTLGTLDWYRSNVSVSWTLSDPESNIYSSTGCTSTTISSETAGTTLTCLATNNAGLSSTASVTIKIDKTVPTASVNRTPAPNGSGWNNSPVTVSFSGTDGLSGIDSCSADVILSTEGTGQSASGTCTDLAGNPSAPVTESGINIDLTYPTINLPATIITPAVFDAGAIVNFTVSASDNLDPSPTFSCNRASGDMFPAGTTTVTCTATDQAGNSAAASFNINVTTKTTLSSTVQQTQSGGNIITVTGGEVISLSCLMELYASGVKLTFINLCGHQTTISNINPGSLPASLPAGYTFVNGVDVLVLKDGKALNQLPNDTGIEMDFPSPGGAEYTLLFWDGSQWIEITNVVNDGDVNSLISDPSENGPARIDAPSNSLTKVLTTEQTGMFVLATK